MAQYLTLLRGINVGGNSLIRMADLKAALIDDGFTDVVTYIQSGNVFVTTPERSKVKVAATVSASIAAHFDLDVKVIAFTKKDWQNVVDSAPDYWGYDQDSKHDLYVVMPPYDVKKAVAEFPELKEGVDQLVAGPGVLYISMLLAKLGSSRVRKIAGTPLYKSLTIRNFNTSTKLLTLFGD